MFLSIIVISCSNDNEAGVIPSNSIVLSASLNGTNEVPANTSTAKGTAYLIYSKTTKVFTIKINYSGLAPTMALIHKETVNNENPIVFTVGKYFDYENPTNALPLIDFTSPHLTTEQETELLTNQYYINLYSSAFPDGEIRGQLINSNLDGSGNKNLY
ncbi:hypothetical protein FEM08_24860 [Flavobacterium gilvum]|nr:hypothetical protein FEM08_24860 [Flavobacterium gilvum]